MEYIVVLESIRNTNRTWTAYNSKENFESWYRGPAKGKEKRLVSEVYKIVEEGISQERAINLCN